MKWTNIQNELGQDLAGVAAGEIVNNVGEPSRSIVWLGVGGFHFGFDPEAARSISAALLVAATEADMLTVQREGVN